VSVEIGLILEIPTTVPAIERMYVVAGREVHGLHISFTLNYYFVQLYKEIMIFVFSTNCPGQIFHFSRHEQEALDRGLKVCSC